MLFLLFSLFFVTQASAAFEKGQEEGISPLIRIFSEDRSALASNINAFKKPSEQGVQIGNSESYYLWQPKMSMSVAKIQFYSSAPGKAFIRLYKSIDDRPGPLLAEVPFQSIKDGWQGISFRQPSFVSAGSSYFISYAHENDIKNCFTADEGRYAVDYYKTTLDFKAIPDDVFAVEVPSLKSVKQDQNSVIIQWNKVTYDYDEYEYIVYRDGEPIASSRKDYFIDEVGQFVEQEKTLHYTVKAFQLDTDMLSDSSQVMSITLQKPIEEPIGDDMMSGDETIVTNDDLSQNEQTDSQEVSQNQDDSQNGAITNESEVGESNSSNSTDSQPSESTNTNSDPVAAIPEIHTNTRRLLLNM